MAPSVWLDARPDLVGSALRLHESPRPYQGDSNLNAELVLARGLVCSPLVGARAGFGCFASRPFFGTALLPPVAIGREKNVRAMLPGQAGPPLFFGGARRSCYVYVSP